MKSVSLTVNRQFRSLAGLMNFSFRFFGGRASWTLTFSVYAQKAHVIADILTITFRSAEQNCYHKLTLSRFDMETNLDNLLDMDLHDIQLRFCFRMS